MDSASNPLLAATRRSDAAALKWSLLLEGCTPGKTPGGQAHPISPKPFMTSCSGGWRRGGRLSLCSPSFGCASSA